MRLLEDNWHPPLSPHSEADRALGRSDLEALRNSYGNVLSQDGNLAYAVFGKDGWTYRVEEYLTHRNAFFGSRLAYEEYLRIARGELEADGGKFRDRILSRPSAPRWREAQDIFWAWTRKAYENKLGPDVDIPKLVNANESEKLKAALRQVQVDFGQPFQRQTMAARPMKASGAYRLGTLSDHALGEAVDIWPKQNPQIEAKQWDGILAFVGKKLDVATRVLWWKTTPEQLHKAIGEIKDLFVSKLAEAVAAQTAAGAQNPLGEVIKASADLQKVGLEWVKEYQNGFFNLPWALVKELHEEKFLWGGDVQTGRSPPFRAVNMRWAFLGLLLSSCTTTPAPQPAADSKPATAQQPTVTSEKAKLDSCKAIGPIGCDMPPRPTSELCQPAHSCLRKMTADDRSVEDLEVQCDIDPVIEPLETGFSKREPAPSGSGVTATTVVNLRSTQDMTSMFDASYLIAEFPEGSCLVDIVHAWEMSRLVWETSLVTRWDEGFVLRIDSTRVLYDEPDEGKAPKEPFCVRLSYRVTEGRFTRLGRESSAGACSSTDASNPRR